MKIEHLRHGSVATLALRPAAGSAPNPHKPGTPAQLLFEAAGATLLKAGDWGCAVAGATPEDGEALEQLRAQSFPRLAWLVSAGQDCTLALQVHTFLHKAMLPECDFGIDEALVADLQRSQRQPLSTARAIEWMIDEFLVSAGGTAHAFLSVDPKAEPGTWQLFGRAAIATLRRTRLDDGRDVLRVEAVKRPQRMAHVPLALVSGALRFADVSVAGRLRTVAAAELSQLAVSGASLLDLWKRYAELEDEAVLERAQQAGILAYSFAESLPDSRYRFTLAPGVANEAIEAFRSALDDGQAIEAAVEAPDVLAPGAGWDVVRTGERKLAGVLFAGEIKDARRDRRLTLTPKDPDQPPPAEGVLFLSLAGDRARMGRRKRAFDEIAEASCPMPQLGLLIEGRPVPSREAGTQAGMPDMVKRKVYGDEEPTRMQRRAVEVALNTPDIALIQGPPGTGKTTVIVALVECLQRMWGGAEGLQGRLLLSGFQHDAVENAIRKMSVNGLPPLKFGGRRGSDSGRAAEIQVEVWAQGRAEAIRLAWPELDEGASPSEIDTLIQSYLEAPGTLEQAGRMLCDLAERLRARLPAAVSGALLELGRELADKSQAARVRDPVRARRVQMVRALRCDVAGFLDDGPQNAQRLHAELQGAGIAAADDLALLERAALWEPGAAHHPAPPFLAALRGMRRRLLLDLTPAAAVYDALPQVRADVLDLLAAARDTLARARRRDGADDAVRAFLQTLEDDPETVQAAVLSYTSVYAATCQQSARYDLMDLRPEAGYDTVVVDEAARADPLDLLVPLAQARRRIVLVGDHRQLPHIIDRKLAAELDAAARRGGADAPNESAMLEKSLFETLFIELRERQARDKIPRVVTLDQQFRMHPALGEFVSAEFYAPHGEAFGSPTPAAKFAHGLPRYPGPAAWLRVPIASGEEHPGQSKSRGCEAKAIVRELQALMDHDAGKPLTFGVITFYSAQVALIQEALVKAGMVELDEDGVAEVVEPYRELTKPNGRYVERLRYGTVDAFQGMEFDVVFVSMVRSNRIPGGQANWRGRYGHLMSPNRLCVAMSRQQRLLIVAGDDGMLRGADAQQAIGPLVRFHRLCEVIDAGKV
jgi:hypothetical protein